MTWFSSGPLTQHPLGDSPLSQDQGVDQGVAAPSARLIRSVDAGGAPGRPRQAVVFSRLTPLDPGDHSGAPSLTTRMATGMAPETPPSVGAYTLPVGGPARPSAGVASPVAPPVAFPRSVPWQGGLRQRADEATFASELRAVYWEAVHAESTVCQSAPSVPIVLVEFIAAVLPGVPTCAAQRASVLSTASAPPTDVELFTAVVAEKIVLAQRTPAPRGAPPANVYSGHGPGGAPPSAAEAAQSLLLLIDVAGLTLRVDLPEAWGAPFIGLLGRLCPACASADCATAARSAPDGAATDPRTSRVPRRTAHAFAFFDSTSDAPHSRFPLPYLGAGLAAPRASLPTPRADQRDSDQGGAVAPDAQALATALLAQARQLLIDDACQREGIQTLWGATRAEAEALLAPWWSLV